MKNITTPKGDGCLYEASDLQGSVYAVCTACMSIYAEFLSWANVHRDRIVKDVAKADNIIVLSCQVTDLAVLNDIRKIEELQRRFPNKKFFVSGCLARRFDITLPHGVERLDNLKVDGTLISDKSLVDFAPPFWVKNFKENGWNDQEGHFLRGKYPFRIGVGCYMKCAYCTIRFTRGEPYEITSLDEFNQADDIVLIADSPSKKQIVFWLEQAKHKNKGIALRNVEPHVALEVWPEVFSFAQLGLLTAFHCPVQAYRVDTLRDMLREPSVTHEVIENVKLIRKFTKTATNIIVDYKNFPNEFDEVYSSFDVVNWNPYWDGVWDRQRAEERFKKYFPWSGEKT